MYIRQCFRTVDGARRAYWAFVESVRTERGPRQNVIAWLGTLDEAGRLGVQQAVRNRLGELFDIEYDLLLYDVTSTFFEGQCNNNPLARRGYSRDQRDDCKQVCIALVVSRCGMPVGYEVFAGNTADVTTVKGIVEMMEQRYGKSDRIWVMANHRRSKELAVANDIAVTAYRVKRKR